MRRFRKLASLPEFTGSLRPGINVDLHRDVDGPTEANQYHNGCDSSDKEEDDSDDSDGGGDDQEDEDISAAVSALISLTIDE